MMRPVDPYAIEVVTSLFPGRGRPEVVRSTGTPDAGTSEWWVLPSRRRARLLVPAGRPGAAVMLSRHGAGARSVARRFVAGAVRSGLAARLPLPRLRLVGQVGQGELEGVLQRLLGQQIVLGVLMGPPRTNRKPVLQVFGPDGATLAFVKVGTDPLTSDLVRREAGCLRRVLAGDLQIVQPPGVLHAGPVGGLEVLALEPLESSQRAGRDSAVAPPLEAMAEVAGSQGIRRETLSTSRFWLDAASAADAVQNPTLRGRVYEVLAQLERRFGAREVVMGSWHGDWAPWNMGTAAGRVQVWDWERYSDAVPWGLDVAHFLAQRVRHDSPVRAEQEQVYRDQLPRVLRSAGEHGPEQDPTIVLLAYLVTICLRFASAEGGAASVPPHARAVWALDLAERVLAEAPVPQ